MSDLTKLFRGKLTPVQFIQKEIRALKSLIGKPATNAALDGAADQVSTLKAQIERSVDAYLRAKLPGDIAPIVEGVTDATLNAIETALKGALIDLKNIDG